MQSYRLPFQSDYEIMVREAGRAPLPAPTRLDTEIERAWEENFGMHGVRKVCVRSTGRTLE